MKNVSLEYLIHLSIHLSLSFLHLLLPPSHSAREKLPKDGAPQEHLRGGEILQAEIGRSPTASPTKEHRVSATPSAAGRGTHAPTKNTRGRDPQGNHGLLEEDQSTGQTRGEMVGVISVSGPASACFIKFKSSYFQCQDIPEKKNKPLLFQVDPFCSFQKESIFCFKAFHLCLKGSWRSVRLRPWLATRESRHRTATSPGFEPEGGARGAPGKAGPSGSPSLRRVAADDTEPASFINMELHEEQIKTTPR